MVTESVERLGVRQANVGFSLLHAAEILEHAERLAGGGVGAIGTAVMEVDTGEEREPERTERRRHADLLDRDRHLAFRAGEVVGEGEEIPAIQVRRRLHPAIGLRDEGLDGAVGTGERGPGVTDAREEHALVVPHVRAHPRETHVLRGDERVTERALRLLV